MTEDAQINVEAGTNAPPELRSIPTDKIFEPALPSREAMDEEAMEDLMASMRELGLLSPLIVFPRDGGYEVIAGHRRLLAAQQLGWAAVQCIVHASPDAARHAMMLHENVVRENLNPAEEAVFLAQLIERDGLNEAALCRVTRRSVQYIADRLNLLRGDVEIFAALRRGAITMAAARELNKFPDEQMRRYYLDAAVRSGCAARVVTTWLNSWRAQQTTPQAAQAEAAGGEAEPAAPPYQLSCFFCGGSRDPYNLVTVQIHRWELDEISRQMQRGGEPTP